MVQEATVRVRRPAGTRLLPSFSKSGHTTGWYVLGHRVQSIPETILLADHDRRPGGLAARQHRRRATGDTYRENRSLRCCFSINPPAAPLLSGPPLGDGVDLAASLDTSPHGLADPPS